MRKSPVRKSSVVEMVECSGFHQMAFGLLSDFRVLVAENITEESCREFL